MEGVPNLSNLTLEQIFDLQKRLKIEIAERSSKALSELIEFVDSILGKQNHILVSVYKPTQGFTNNVVCIHWIDSGLQILFDNESNFKLQRRQDEKFFTLGEKNEYYEFLCDIQPKLNLLVSKYNKLVETYSSIMKIKLHF